MIILCQAVGSEGVACRAKHPISLFNSTTPEAMRAAPAAAPLAAPAASSGSSGNFQVLRASPAEAAGRGGEVVNMG